MTQEEEFAEYKKGLEIYKPEKWLNWDEHYYLRNWKKDSDHFLEKGYYKWMAEELGKYVNPKTLLDIGCGNGNAIIQLLKSFPSLEKVIAIEIKGFQIIRLFKHDVHCTFNLLDCPCVAETECLRG